MSSYTYTRHKLFAVRAAPRVLLFVALSMLFASGCAIQQGGATATPPASPAESVSPEPSVTLPVTPAVIPTPTGSVTPTTSGTPFITPTPSSTPAKSAFPPASVTPRATPTPRQFSAAEPLIDMAANDRYKGEDGGLYGNGLNMPPPSHRDAALKQLAMVKPLDAKGAPSPDGKVVLISMGMSNTTQEFSVFKRLADADPERSPSLRIVDGAQGGQTSRIWASQEQPWQVLAQRLQAAGVTAQQVQMVWLKQANAQPTRPFPEEAKELRGQLATIVRLLKERYPNVRVVYLSSRIYAGYATTGLNPEPHAFESAFAVRWLIQSQIDGDPGLNYDPEVGPVTSPLLLWGPYLWADGLNPRSDGLTWERSELSPQDGTHPSDTGREKVARLLLAFFKTEELARSWFVESS